MPRKKKVRSSPQVMIGGRLWPETKSGDAYFLELTDQEALALQPGDTVFRQLSNEGLVILTVENVRLGLAGNLGEQFDVPVIEGYITGHKSAVYAVNDCYLVALV